MSNQERLSPPERLGECDFLIANTLQMQHNHQVLAEYITAIKRQLDNLTEQFNNRPELQQIANLQDASDQEHRQLGEHSAASEVSVEVTETEVTGWFEEIPQSIHVQSYEYQLVFDRPKSRSVLREALCESQERLIIVCPWLNRNSIDDDLLQQFRDCLNRNCRIDIGWGYLSERSRVGIGWRYNALKDLRQLEQDYPEYFKLKLLGTHEKFLVCDRAFAMLGSHNMLTSSAQSAEREAGIRTTDPQIIQGLIDRFDGAEMQAQDTDEMTAGFVSLNDTEVDAVDIGYQSDTSPVNLYDIELDKDEDDSTEDGQGTAINAEEFLRRYEAGERDFTGINLAGANLCGLSLTDINLSKANLTKANLTKANLSNTNLSGAKLSEANLLEAILISANFTGADLRSAELSAARLDGAKLVGTNLNGAGLIQSELHAADLSGANLSYANFTAASLPSANLMKANLKGTNLAAANLSSSNLRKAEFNDKTKLSGANLSSVNLAGQDFQKINMSGVDLSYANLCGACLCASNLSGADLTSTDLRGADLRIANLEKANLKGANLSGADLNKANLSGAIMPDGKTHE